MKKLYLILIAAIVISACENESITPNENILGEWQNTTVTETATENEVLIYLFNNDNTVEITRTVVDTNTGNTLGYRLRATGTFAFNGSELSMTLSEVYQNTDTDNNYDTLENLVLTDYMWNEEVSVQFQEDFYQMTITYPNCGPADNCLTQQIFTRTYSPAQT